MDSGTLTPMWLGTPNGNLRTVARGQRRREGPGGRGNVWRRSASASARCGGSRTTHHSCHAMLRSMKATKHGDHLIRLNRLGFVNAYLVREDDGLTLVDTT